MFQGKMKAVTFSFDDGVTQDRRLIKLFDKYGLKCTFNLNSGRMDEAKRLEVDGKSVAWVKPKAEEIAAIYQNHEVAAHSVSHPSFKTRSKREVIKEVEKDREALSALCGYEVEGFAYPAGSGHIDEDSIQAVRTGTKVKYARNTTASGNFDLPKDLFWLCPTDHCHELDRITVLAKEFIALKPDSPKLLYLWGHAYEFDAIENGWERFEAFCALISGKEDIFYGTNTECLQELL